MTAPTYAPDSPTVAASEWLPYLERGFPISASQSPGVVSTPGVLGAAPVDLRVKLASVIGAPVINADVIRLADVGAANGAAADDLNRPSGDLTSLNIVHAGGSGVAPFYVDIDNATVNTAVYLTNNTGTTSGYAFIQLPTGAWPAGRRVLSVTLHLVMVSSTGSTTITPGIAMNFPTSTRYQLAQRTIGTTQTQIDDITWTTNPVTGLPWTQADIQALATGTLNGIGFDWTTTSNVLGAMRWLQGWVTIKWIAENRLATGTVTPTTDGWATIPLATPTGGAWNFAAATRYLTVLSIPSGVGSAVWKGVQGFSALTGFQKYAVTVDGVTFMPTAIGAATDLGVPGHAFRSAGPVVQWGQPYCKIIPVEVASGEEVQQEITLPSAADRASLAFVAQAHSLTTIDSLIARMRRRSDNIQVGGDLTVTPNEIRDKPRIPQVITLPFASAAVGPSGQIYIDWTSTAAVGRGWNLLTASVDDAESGALAALGIGAGTDQVTIYGVDSVDQDVPVSLFTARAAPTALAVVAAA